MADLTLAAQPGFTEIADGSFNDGSAVAAATMKGLNSDAKFAVVRNEQFWGYYRHGETVALPVSAADGYAYGRDELVYTWSVYWSGGAPNPCNGTQVAPARGATGGAGQLLQLGYNVDQATGAVTCNASYYKDSQHDTNDGILLVMVHAQRLR